MLSYLFIEGEGDKDAVAKFIDRFSSYTDVDLLDYYNKQQNLGFVGVKAQAQAIVAINIAFIRRFGKSPINVSENLIIEFTGSIIIHDGIWIHVATKN